MGGAAEKGKSPARGIESDESNKMPVKRFRPMKDTKSWKSPSNLFSIIRLKIPLLAMFAGGFHLRNVLPMMNPRSGDRKPLADKSFSESESLAPETILGNIPYRLAEFGQAVRKSGRDKRP